MDPLISGLLGIYAWGRRLVWFLAIIPTARTYLSAISDGLPEHHVWALSLWVLATALCSILVLIFIVDELILTIPEIRERRKFASELDALVWNGHKELTLQQIVQRWTGDKPASEERQQDRDLWTLRLRQLKAAIYRGWIQSDMQEDGDASRSTKCSVASVAAFLRSVWQWRQLEDRDYLQIVEDRQRNKTAK